MINMSVFSGKCDVYDHFAMGDNPEEEIKNTNIYIWGNDNRRHLLRVDTIKDLAKYYPYLIACGTWADGKGIIELSSRSFIDREEEEHISWQIKDVLKYWRKCKRNKIPFDEEECYRTVNYWRDNDAALKEIISRVAKDGDKATFKGIHKPMWEHYRKAWFEELVSLGYGEFEAFCWCFNEFFPKPEVVEKRLGRKLESNPWEKE